MGGCKGLIYTFNEVRGLQVQHVSALDPGRSEFSGHVMSATA